MAGSRTSENQDVWLEVALNGGAGTAYQPLIPITPDAIIKQGIECAKAGAAIVHLHVYDNSGKPCEDIDIYAHVIEGIKSECDVIVYPTLGFSGTAEERFAPLSELSRRGLLEWSVVDPGSVNLTHTSQIATGMDGFMYQNSDAHIRHGLNLAAQEGWRPAYAIYEPGFARLGAAVAATIPNLRTPIYRIMLSDNLLFGMKPSIKALEFYASHLSETAPDAQWMVSGLDAEIDDIIAPAIALGAHIRVGLEDAPFGTTLTNIQLVEAAIKTIETNGHKLATVDQVRSDG